MTVKAQPKITHRFTINEKKWVHGTKSAEAEDSALLNEDGKYCCLGFFGKSCGFGDDSMKGIGRPVELEFEANSVKPAFLKLFKDMDFQEAADVQEELISANDDMGFTLSQRRAKVAKLFLQMGVAVKFSGAVKKK